MENIEDDERDSSAKHVTYTLLDDGQESAAKYNIDTVNGTQQVKSLDDEGDSAAKCNVETVNGTQQLRSVCRISQPYTRACPEYSTQLVEAGDMISQLNVRACPAVYGTQTVAADGQNSHTGVCSTRRGYRSKINKCNWRDRVQGIWEDVNYGQRCVVNMKFLTIMQVPSSKGSRLLRELINQEGGLAKLTGYNIRYVEKSDVLLARMFSRLFQPKIFHREHCPVCTYTDAKKSQNAEFLT